MPGERNISLGDEHNLEGDHDDMANPPTLTDTSNSDSSSDTSHDSSESYQSDDGPPGLLPAGQMGAESGEETGTTSDYGSKSGGSEDDDVEPPPLMAEQAEDPETIRKAGNDLFNNDNIEGAIEKYKEAIAAGSKGGVQMSAENLAKTYSNIAHCYNKKRKYREAIEASFLAIEAKWDFHRPYIRLGFSYKELENTRMALLALLKGKAIPGADSNLKSEITKALAEFEDVTKTEVKQYIQREAAGKARDVNLQAARDARYGEPPASREPSPPPAKPVEDVKPAETEESMMFSAPGLMASDDEDDPLSEGEADVTMVGAQPCPPPEQAEGSARKSPPSLPKLTNGSNNSDSSDDEDTKPTAAGKKKKSKKSKQDRVREDTKRKLEQDVNEKVSETVKEEVEAATKKAEYKAKMDNKLREEKRAEKEDEARKKREAEEKKRLAEVEKKRQEEEQKKREDAEAREVARKKAVEEKRIKAEATSGTVISQRFGAKLRDADQAFRSKIMVQSMELYSEALELIDKQWGQLNLRAKDKSSSQRVIVIKYMYARAATETASYAAIKLGRDVLVEIQTAHKEVRFPAAFLALAQLFKKLNRHEKALEYAERGSDYLSKGLPCPPTTWPGSETEVMQETQEEFLKSSLATLAIEMKCPARPDAVCKYSNCGRVQENIHIIPSTSIYLNDPDFCNLYSVVCFKDCILDFHSDCWDVYKNEFINVLKTTKTPSERDFFGSPCFTPDCGSSIVRILITDQNGKVKTLDNEKIIAKLELDEKKMKEEEKRKRELEDEERKRKKHEEKMKKLEQKIKERTPTSSEKELGDNKEVKTEALGGSKNSAAEKLSNPAADIPLDQITILKKQKDITEPEAADKKKSKKAQKERTVLSLDEFTNPEPAGDYHGDYQERLNRLAAIKKTFEERGGVYPPNNSAPPPTQQPSTLSYGDSSGSGQQANVSLEAKISKYLNRPEKDAAVSIGQDVMIESIKTDVLQKLRQLGPLKESDTRLVANLGAEGKSLVMEKAGMVAFLKSDERFGSYADYVCLRGEAERAKTLHEAVKEVAVEGEQRPRSNLGELARRMRQQLEGSGREVVEGGGEQEVLEEKGEEDIVVEETREIIDIQGREVQTDLSSSDLDQLSDPLKLQQTNSALASELQETKDKMYKMQNERKVELADVQDRVKVTKAENSKLKSDLREITAKGQKMETAYKEGLRRDEEFSKTKNTLAVKAQQLDTSQSQLDTMARKLTKEQELSFQLQTQLRAEKEARAQDVKMLRLRNLKDQHESLKNLLAKRKLDNEQNIQYLGVIFRGQDQNSQASVRSSMEKLNEFSARLIQTADLLKSKYEELVKQVPTAPMSQYLEINIDLTQLEAPSLTPQEADTLRLLATLAAAPRPAPFPGISRPLPGSYPGPPPPIQQGAPRLVAPPPGMMRPPSVVDQLAGLAPQAGQRPPGSLSRAPGPARAPQMPGPATRAPQLAPGGPARAPQLPIGTAPKPPNASRAPGGPTSSPRARGVQLASTAAMGAVGGAPAPSAEGRPKRSSHDKLIEKLRATYPDLSHSDGAKYINILRDQNQGKLSGMSIPIIEQKVGELMRRDRAALHNTLEAPQDTNCSVCFENMDENNSRRLNPCGHRFHNQCINEWMSTSGGAGNTCPMCRHYIVQEDEFPDLGHAGHRRH